MSYANYVDRPLPFVVTYLTDLFRFRDLIGNLVASDLRSRFRRSRLGLLWAVLQPLCFSLMLAFVWGTLFKNKSFWEFTIYAFSGLIVWDFLVNSVMGGLNALILAAGYLKQSRIPFLVFQARIPITSSIMFLFALGGLTALMAALQLLPPLNWSSLLVLAFVPMMLALTLPLSILFSFLGAQFRDTQHIMMLVMQGLFFISPVMLDRQVLTQPELAWLQYANPGVVVLDLFRDPMIYGQAWSSNTLITFGAWTAGLWALAVIVSLRFGRRIVFAL